MYPFITAPRVHCHALTLHFTLPIAPTTPVILSIYSCLYETVVPSCLTAHDILISCVLTVTDIRLLEPLETFVLYTFLPSTAQL